MPVRWDNIKLQARLRAIVLAIAVALVAGHWVATMLKPRGDFSRHWEFGRRFVADEFLYADGLDVPYPPFFAVAYAPLSLLPLRVAKPVFFLVGFAALAGLLWILNALTRKALPLSRERLFWVGAATLLVASRFVSRDFADGGQNLVLLGLTWLAIYLWKIGRNISAGASLGLAIALKCTPGLFVAYFAWKRQWRFAAASLLFAAAFTLAPALRQSTYALHMQTWFDAVYQGVNQPDPSVGVLGPEELQNKSLRPALARYLMHLAPDAPGRVDSAGYIEFLDLQPRAAGTIIKVVMLVLLGWIVWMLRRPLTGRDDPMLVWECATISLLMLLYSPITWGQHCVAVIPALYLLFRTIAVGHALPRWMYWTLGGVAFVVLFANRSIVGRDLSLLLESYHLVTFCLIALLVVVLGCQRRAHE
ncbi:MAG TPA: glycosyltransferase family 87 protein [Chthoniobacter sp.]|nr:glycosyltransferase family 87 protein [Chthoniobacter sp.]